MASNTIKVLTAISKEISRRFDVRADLVNSVNRQYDKPHTAFGSNSGSSIQIKQPQKLTATESATLDIQDMVENTATLNVNNDVHVGLGFTAAELTQDLMNPSNMKMFADDYLDSAVDNIISKIQGNLSTYINENTFNSVGTPGTGPTSYQVITQARAKLNNNRAPRSGRCFVLNPDDAALLNNAQIGGTNNLFNTSGSMYDDGTLNPANGFMFKECPDYSAWTSGTQTDFAGTENGGSQTGATFNVDALANSLTVTAGTVFTAAGCYAVDPVSGATKGNLQQFVVTADATSNGSGEIALAISPSITTTGAYKTCSASPDAGGVVTFNPIAASTVYGQGVAMHKDAFVLGTAELADIGVKYEVPIITSGAGDGYSKADGPAKGLYMKLYMDGDITNRRAVARLDCRYGYTSLIPEWACKIQGA